LHRGAQWYRQDTITTGSEIGLLSRRRCAAIARSDAQTTYGHNLESFLGENPYLGVLLLQGMSGKLAAPCN
jgi:hypothetical protein